MNYSFKTPEEILALLGKRLRRLRLNRNFSQQQLADKAGISMRALRNLETGQGSSTETLVRVLKALDSLSGLDALAPEPTVNPLLLMARAGKRPQRASHPRRRRPEE